MDNFMKLHNHNSSSYKYNSNNNTNEVRKAEPRRGRIYRK